MALGENDLAFEVMERAIRNRAPILIGTLRTAKWWDPLRSDPRFDEMLALLESMETHTDAYLQQQDAAAR